MTASATRMDTVGNINQNNENRTSAFHKFLTALGTVLTVILVPMLLINCILIARSMINESEVPSVGGYVPFIVLSDSMYSEIQSGDLLICHTVEASNVNVGDVIAFYDPASDGSSIVAHRVIDITTEDGVLYFQTKGDANNVADAALVPEENLIGVYQHRLAGIGNVALFTQTQAGLIVCVVLPLVLLVGYDVIRRRAYEKKKRAEEEEMLAELERLRRQKARELDWE